MGTKEDDFVEHLFIATTHQYILLFTSLGRMYWLKVYEIPEASRTAKGKAIVNLIRLQEGETVEAMIPVKEFAENSFLVMATELGVIKRTRLTAFSNPRAGGIIAITLDTSDRLLRVIQTSEDTEIVLATRMGKAIRFNAGSIREIGRTGKGVRGIKLRPKDKLVGMEVLNTGDSLLTVTTKGFGKRTFFDEYRAQSRGGQGTINIKTTERNGEVVTIRTVSDKDELMIITTSGNIIRMELKNFKAVGRNAQGVRMIKLTDEKDYVGGVARVISKEEDEE
jgi:DNA gyrase subunit A